MSNCSLTTVRKIPNVHLPLQKLNENEDIADESLFESENFVESKASTNWIQKCSISVSPTLDFACIAQGNTATFYKGDTRSCSGSLETFTSSWNGSLCPESEDITRVLSLPIVLNKHSSIGYPDWTCVIVGFSSGSIHFYTEDGVQLISQKFHHGTVVDIKCQVCDYQHFENKSLFKPKNELTILYNDSLVIVDGNSLFQSLRTCRTQQALVAAGRMFSPDVQTLSYKKMRCIGQDGMTGHASPCNMDLSSYDELQRACLSEGYNADIPLYHMPVYQLVSCGSSPFVGFYHSSNISSDFAFTQVASAVANKLKTAFHSAASGWLGWGQSREEKQVVPEQKIEQGMPVEIKFGLPDYQRCGTSIAIAPYSKHLAAVTDTFGRVVLLDIAKGYVLRMWKGYRDAQVAFKRVFDDTEDQQKHLSKSTLFLIIYAPRRGILEVWSCLYGPRVAAFNITKNARLISIGHGMLNLDGIGSSTATNITRNISCCLLSGDGEISDITIPFHLALSDSKSNRARHIHLFKKINKLLHEKPCDVQAISKLLLDMDLCTFQKQAFEKLILIELISGDVLLDCIDKMMAPLKIKDKGKEDLLFIDYLDQIRLSINLYKNVQNFNSEDESMETDKQTDLNTNDFVEMLWKEIKEKNCVDKYCSFVYGDEDLMVSEEKMSICQVLVIFNGREREKRNEKIWNIKHSLKLGQLVFNQSLLGRVDPNVVVSTLNEYNSVTSEDWLLLLFSYFIKQENKFMKTLEVSVRSLCQFILGFQEKFQPKELDDWKDFFAICTESKCSAAAYIVALICKTYHVKQQSNVNQEKSHTQKEWESLCMVSEHWTTILHQLDQCISLNTFLAMGHKLSSVFNQASELKCASVDEILTSGKGFIPELIASVLHQAKIPCSSLFEDAQETNDTSSSTQQEFLDLWKNVVYKKFKFCLDPNILHAHCFWDIALAWNKEVQTVSLLLQACLELDKIKCDPHLKYGLSLMAWKTFVMKRFSSMAYLLDKVGKHPKDRLCIKDVGVHDTELNSFCECCTRILSSIADSDPDVFPQHQLGDRHGREADDVTWGEISGKESIVDIAKSQPSSLFTLTQHLLHLSIFMQGITRFQLRGVKPLSKLFEANIKQFLTMDHSQSSRSPTSVKSHIVTERTNFFCKVIVAAVSKKDYSGAHEWMETCDQLAPSLHINSDVVMVRFVYLEQLLMHGLDEDAFKASNLLSDISLLGGKLLEVSGKRFAFYLNTVEAEERVMLMSQLPPLVTSWIKAQKLETFHCPVSIYDVKRLVSQTLSYLAEDSDQYQFALKLSDALSPI